MVGIDDERSIKGSGPRLWKVFMTRGAVKTEDRGCGRY